MDLDHDACYRAISQRDIRFDGRFFTGVKTTGIYCRPVCPATTPKSTNITFYPTAAAAREAGLRPCLRCRPETAPDMGAWRGTSNTVSRALRLIEQGALDDAPVEALATRLGVGGRQLRRLFHQHLGASPVAVAQTRRIHLAKQLIHETDMPMAQIAFASGFGSIRRFNECFQDMFARPPAALRRDGHAAGLAPAAGDGLTLTLRYRPPYDWDGIRDFLRVRAIAGIERVEGNCYARSFAIDGHQGQISVEPAADSHAIRATIHTPDLAILPAIIARLRRVFDLATDPDAIAAHLGQDPLLHDLVAACPGLRVPGAWDGFELAIRAVLGQQVTLAAAARLAGDLVARFGAPLEIPCGSLTHSFPAPERLASADLTVLGMPRARAATLSAVARARLENPGLFEARSDLDTTIRDLRAIPGIGDWTAQYIALRQMREPDAFPAADIGLMRAVATVENTARPDAAALLERARAWQPWRAYAAQYLWRADSAARAGC